MTDRHRAGPDWPFWLTIATVSAAYLAFLVVMLLATATYTSPHHLGPGPALERDRVCNGA